MRVDVPESRISDEVKKRLQSMSKSVRIKGFRPGKAPLKVVQKHYAEQVRQEVVGEVVKSSLFDAIAKENLQLAVPPRLEKIDPKASDGVTFTATIEVLPDIELTSVETFTIDKPNCVITDQAFDEMIESMRRQHRTLQAVERPAKTSDALVIDFVGRIDGAPFDGGSANNFVLELGGGRFIEGFERGLLDVRSDERRTLDITLPEGHVKADLAGKKATFEVHVKSVNVLVLPDLNDEFFSKMGVESGGIEAFRAEVRHSMEREAKQNVDNRIKHAIMDKLFTANPIDVPPSLVAHEAERLEKHARSSMQGADHVAGDLPAEALAQLKQQAKKRVALKLVVGQLIKTHNISVDPSRVRTIIEGIASAYKDSAAVSSWYYADKQRLSEIEGLALEEQVVDWIMARATINEIDTPFDVLLNNRQT